MAMLFSLVGSAAASSVAEPVDLVLAVKEGDKVDWAQQYAGRARVIAYNKGQQPLGLSSISEVALPNVGREAHAYLHHIVHRFDSLAAKTVFMPGGLPTAGFNGFAQSGGSLLPGAKLDDYLSSDSAELMVPTMALSKDLKQFSVRMSLMDNKTESNVEGGKRFGVCSADGSAGWSPFLPNKFASSVLEPLMTQQHAQWDFPSFWARYMPTVQLPEHILAAHGAVFSVTRENIRSHPKHFYEGLLAELEGSKDPYQSFFLEHMWWYVFHSREAAPCEADFAPQQGTSRASASRKLGSNRRKLANVYTLVQPHAGQQVDFGSTINVQWSVNNDGYQRVELWRYGSFVTRLYNSMYGYANTVKEVNWHVEPGPNVDSADMTISANKSFMALQDGAQIQAGKPTKAWLQFFKNFQPGDKYTVRVCAYSDNEDEEICDDTYGESGEFNINAVVRMLSPVQANTYKPGDFIPITWQSYFVSGNKVNIRMKKESRIVWQKNAVDDTGAYTFYVPPDMGPGLYNIEVVGMDPATDPCLDTAVPTGLYPGGSCAGWAGKCSTASSRYIVACTPFVTTAAIASTPGTPYVPAVVSTTTINGTTTTTIITPAVAAVPGTPAVAVTYTPSIAGMFEWLGPIQAPSPSVTPTWPLTGYATTSDGKFIYSPDKFGTVCTPGDLFSPENMYMGSGVGGVGSGVVAGTANAFALRAACPQTCGTCPGVFSAGRVDTCASSTCQTTFTMGAHPPPPAPPLGVPVAAVQWEVPIIQAFKGSFGLDEIKQGPGPHGSIISSTSTVSKEVGTHPGGLNCDYVCHVYDQSNGIVGGSRGRRLLFGGLQTFSQVDTNTFVGCSQDMRDCGCCNTG